MPLPCGLGIPVNLAASAALTTSAGAVPSTKVVMAADTCSRTASSSATPSQCSYLPPPGPAPLLRGYLRRPLAIADCMASQVPVLSSAPTGQASSWLADSGLAFPLSLLCGPCLWTGSSLAMTSSADASPVVPQTAAAAQLISPASSKPSTIRMVAACASLWSLSLALVSTSAHTAPH